MRKPWKITKLIMAVLMIAAMLLPVAPTSAAPQVTADQQAVAATGSTDPFWFPQTGHYVSGRFRQYWEANGGLFVFGFPLTKAYNEVSTDGNTYLTQYFERARFEYHPEKSQPYDVLLTLVGNEVTANRKAEGPFQPIANPNNGNAYFADTGHTLSGAFLDFWTQYGGLQNFGFPLSEPFTETNSVDGKQYTVQYFERGRWELHPEIADPKYAVLLGLMGLERANRLNIGADVRGAETNPPRGDFIPGNAGGLVPVNHIEYGFNTFMVGGNNDGSFNNGTISKVQEAGFGWVRLQLIWKDFEREPGNYDFSILDPQINAAHYGNRRIMLSVLKSPEWAQPGGGLPENQAGLDAFYNLMRTVAGRYAGKIQAYEIWNEQNLAGEVGGNVRVAPYINVLKNGYLGVKKNDPTAWVLFGGLTPTGVNKPNVAIDDVSYLQQFYAYNNGEGKQYYDALGAHPGSASNAPDVRFPNGTGQCPPAATERYGSANGTCWNSSPDFYFRRIEEQRAVMEQNGESAKQIWLTEFGWDSCVGGAPAPAGYEYCQLISREQQAANIVRAFQIGKNEWPWMGVMFLWNLNYGAAPDIPANDEKYGWSVLGPGFTNLPAFDAIKNMPK